MKRTTLFICLLLNLSVFAQERKTENVFIVTMDGYRWKELFNGAERQLLTDKRFVSSDSATLHDLYWAETAEARRKKLMPFFWNTIASHGQIYGNRALGNYVNVKNRYHFSYPGYNEIFTGYPDTLINSNDYPPNPNVNVLEFINSQDGYKNKVGVFASWDAYYRILNEGRSGLYINSGWKEVTGSNLSETQKLLNEQQAFLPRVFGPTERLDASTFFLATEYIKQIHPRVFYLALIDTDAFGHQGAYDLYLNAAHNADAMIDSLWSYIQNDPLYKDRTTLIITTDHGRGENEKWRSHFYNVPHSNETWLAVIGPDTRPLGEVKQKGQLHHNQIANTIAGLLGLKFTTKNETGEAIKSILSR